MMERIGMNPDLETILEAIKQADVCEIYEIVDAAMDAYRAAYPDREIMFLSVPKHDPRERRRIPAHVINLLKEHELI